MYRAIIDLPYNQEVRLGPTDSRDEAARLARSWIDKCGGKSRDSEVRQVRIERMDDDDE